MECGVAWCNVWSGLESSVVWCSVVYLMWWSGAHWSGVEWSALPGKVGMRFGCGVLSTCASCRCRPRAQGGAIIRL